MKIILEIIKYLYGIYKPNKLDTFNFYLELEKNTKNQTIKSLLDKAKNTEAFKLLMGIYVHDDKKKELLTQLYLDDIIFTNSEPEILYRLTKDNENIVYLEARKHHKINYIVPEIVGIILVSTIPISLLDIFNIYHMSTPLASIYLILLLLSILFIKPAFSILSIRNEEKNLVEKLNAYNRKSLE